MTNFSVITAAPAIEGEGDDQFPPYSAPGRILFEIYHIYNCGQTRRGARYELEIHDYDNDSGVFWLAEGQGIDYWLDDHIDLEDTGFYVLEGVTGTYYRGDGWSTDDDEEWEFILCRRATDEEIQTLALADRGEPHAN